VELTTPARCLSAALAAFLVDAQATELALVTGGRTWSGVGLIVVGMARPGWDVQLAANGDGHCGPRSR
jgi:hypothetical protein